MKIELAAPVDVYVAPIVFGEDMTRQCREERALAVLLDEIFGPECERVHDASGAPVVLCRGRRVEAAVSISHSMHYAAVAVGSPGYEVGIDIEERRSQLSRVCPRVLSAPELSAYKERPDGLLEAWTLKEALYKAWRRHSGGEIDFGRQLHLPMPPGQAGRIRRMPLGRRGRIMRHLAVGLIFRGNMRVCRWFTEAYQISGGDGGRSR